MASTFKVKTSRDIGISLTSVGGYTVPVSTTSTAIGLSLSNTTSQSVSADVAVNDGVNDTYIIKNVLLPKGSTLVVIGGEQKVVLETGYSIKIKSTAVNSIDAVLSILELTI